MESIDKESGNWYQAPLTIHSSLKNDLLLFPGKARRAIRDPAHTQVIVGRVSKQVAITTTMLKHVFDNVALPTAPLNPPYESFSVVIAAGPFTDRRGSNLKDDALKKLLDEIRRLSPAVAILVWTYLLEALTSARLVRLPIHKIQRLSVAKSLSTSFTNKRSMRLPMRFCQQERSW